MTEQGVRGFDRARRKAAERIGVDDSRLWPRNREIQEALSEQQRLFQGEGREDVLADLRAQALKAMRILADFAPGFMDPVLCGGIDDHTPVVRLHLFTDSPEDVLFVLFDRGIPWHEGEEIFRYGRGLRQAHPVYAFLAGDTAFELVVLPLWAQRNPPLDRIDDLPRRGLGIAELARLSGDTA